MSYKLFLDDERDSPCDNTKCVTGVPVPKWVIARSSSEAIELVKTKGIPSFISFDHDLGGDDTAMKFIWFLINSHIEGSIEAFPTSYYVHSQNPIGVENIKGLMESYIRSIT